MGGNQNRYNAVQNVGNQVVQNAVQNMGVQKVRNLNGLIVVPRIANQNSNRNGNVVAARAEGNANKDNDGWACVAGWLVSGSLHAPGFHFEPFHEVFDGLSVILLDVMGFYKIFDGVNGSTSSHIHGIVKSSSSVVPVVIAIFVVDQCPVGGVGVIMRLPNASEAFLILKAVSIRSVQPVRAASTTRKISGACPSWFGLGCAWRDVLVIFFTEILDVNPRCSIRVSQIGYRLRDSGHNEGCVSHCAHSSENNP
uniref:Uncharacterized protein n=1 Tax=Tanacetum cinerariifolium TaxID=118510 RepID=A0A6L2KI88_TANCI|nr:hypothetical protein [Tanacetum cinerariifolium]